ncbi:hypothetical protein SBRY_50172 [Actinacidiphila bryophytorum]|uniref:Protein kinase domain-containing protein n=1 Tax=Actinacidiphila bryophytorum TaxID=1436133 RepID=A0A9W4MJ33_9ACTN|nr:hypothetical protein SBRY_50172 [Actinacidiphila bryophytorum]
MWGGRRAMTPLSAEDPSSIGGYTLLGRLGAGGMGVVYLGVSASGRQVAVKFVRGSYAEDEEFRGRFRQEVAAARRVSGAFTAPVVDGGGAGRRPVRPVLGRHRARPGRRRLLRPLQRLGHRGVGGQRQAAVAEGHGHGEPVGARGVGGVQAGLLREPLRAPAGPGQPHRGGGVAHPRAGRHGRQGDRHPAEPAAGRGRPGGDGRRHGLLPQPERPARLLTDRPPRWDIQRGL